MAEEVGSVVIQMDSIRAWRYLLAVLRKNANHGDILKVERFRLALMFMFGLNGSMGEVNGKFGCDGATHLT